VISPAIPRCTSSPAVTPIRTRYGAWDGRD
jgi:hypothetical protein